MRASRPRSLRFWLSYAVAITATAWAACAWAAAEIAVVLSDDSAAYREVAEAVRAGLARSPGTQVAVRMLPVTALDNLPRQDLQAIVTVGARAARAVATRELNAPVLNTLVPRNAFEHIAAESGRAGDPRRFSAVFLDQPAARQLDLIRLALPEAGRVGLLLGPESESLYTAVQVAAVGRRLRISAQKVGTENQLYPALQKVLGEADVLLALPDPAVFNGTTISNILLTTYRQQLPVIGFSAAYTHAGAVLALYSTPAQIGSQAAEMLRGALTTGLLAPPQYPRDFLVSTNPHVARSLGLMIEDAAVLRSKLSAAERP